MIALFGGSFDPIHLGHLQNAYFLQQQFKFDEFFMLPCGDPPHKNGLLFSQRKRLEMLNLALLDYPSLSSNTFEFNNKKSYTTDTLQHFYKKYHSICFIMGSDSFIDLPNWEEFETFPALTNIIVLGRNNRDDKNIDNMCGFQIEDNIERFKNSVGKVHFAKNNLINISSTQIRRKIDNQENLRDFLPNQVIQYINEQHTKTTN